ncbi:MAG: MOSC domain-containing protein [Rhodothermales bacterium]|nr:MOSC domain-containing protein [Rhodothermales bacterium]
MKLVSVNIGKARPTDASSVGQTGIFKKPAAGPVHITPNGAKGDAVCDDSCHGGPDQAIYVYTQPDYGWWSHEIGYTPKPGSFGDNLTVSGLLSQNVCVGDRLIFPEVELEVTAPRIPCGTLAAKMQDPQFVKKFKNAERPGFYCRVISNGMIEQGQNYRFESGPYGVSLVEIFRDYYTQDASRDILEAFLAAPIAIRTRESIKSRLAELVD